MFTEKRLGRASLPRRIPPESLVPFLSQGGRGVQIDAASQKAAALTRQLLAFGRQQDLAPTCVDSNEIVEGLAR